MERWEGLEEVVAIADSGSFTGGAGLLGVSTSYISKAVARLESRLGAQLLNRTTRKVGLTDTGRAFVDQCRRIIQERDELLSQVQGASEPQGFVRLTCSIAMGEKFIAPISRRFAESNPRISIALDLTNRVVDLVGEGYDIGIRTGDIVDARLTGRQIATRSTELCAAPGYLERKGVPTSIDELQAHECIVGTSGIWHFIQRGVSRHFTPAGRWRCNNGAAVLDATIAGMGICQLPEFYVRQHVKEGRLVPLLEKCKPEPEPVWAVYPQRRHLMPKVRTFVDLLEEQLPIALSE